MTEDQLMAGLEAAGNTVRKTKLSEHCNLYSVDSPDKGYAMAKPQYTFVERIKIDYTCPHCRKTIEGHLIDMSDFSVKDEPYSDDNQQFAALSILCQRCRKIINFD